MAALNLWLNGVPPTRARYEQDCLNAPLWCADGAYHQAVAIGLTPARVLGDMDSISVTPDVDVSVLADQDFTDFEKILGLAVSDGFNQVHVFGSSGGEGDHWLGNLSVLKTFHQRLQLTLFDQFQRIQCFTDRIDVDSRPGQIVSVMPFPAITKTHYEGLVYPAENLDFQLGGRTGIRNQATGDRVRITCSGTALIFQEWP